MFKDGQIDTRTVSWKKTTIPRHVFLGRKRAILFSGTFYQAAESSHYEAHYSNITFSEARSSCTDYGGKLAEFPADYNFSVLIASIGLPADSQFWINGK